MEKSIINKNNFKQILNPVLLLPTVNTTLMKRCLGTFPCQPCNIDVTL